MLRIFVFMLAAYLAGRADAAPQSPLSGVWVEVNGPGKARIGPCPQTPDRLCAFGLDRSVADRPVETGLVMSDVRPSGTGRWKGSYHDGTRRLPATLQLVSAREVRMKVCLLMLCQSATYVRAE